MVILFPPNTPPQPRDRPPPTDYSPFINRSHFECADFLYRDEQMSGGGIDRFMQILAAFYQQSGAAPYEDADDLYDTLDQIPLGDVPWWSFSVSYQGPLPEGDVPKWMTDEYVVWYRCPDQVLRNQIANPSYRGGG